MNTLGSRIKVARMVKDMTQAELHRASGVAQGDISKLENGSVAGSTKVVQLARALGCDPYWLATGKGEPWNQEATEAFESGDNVAHLEGLRVKGASLLLEGGIEIDKDDPSTQGVVLWSGVSTGYAIRAKGDRNAPAIKDGQFLIVETAPVPPGDIGLFSLHNGRVLLRELLRETVDTYYVDSAAWGARQTIPKSDVLETERVVAVVSPSQWRKLE